MIVLILNSILLGAGLAMDAFSASLANGLHEPDMKSGRVRLIAGTFAAFQFLMPLIGWLTVTFAESTLRNFNRLVPYIALLLLAFLGIKMIIDGVKESGTVHSDGDEEFKRLSTGALIVQGIATSIDALSAGLATAGQSPIRALISSAVIGMVTFVICIAGIFIGRKVGMKIAGKASIVGGIILIGIGIEIFLTNILS